MDTISANDAAFRTSAGEEMTELSSNEVNELMNSHLNDSDDFFGDEFDPDELLNSPLFNEPRSKFMIETESYNDFAEEDDEEESDKTTPMFNVVRSNGFDSFNGSKNASETLAGFMTQPTPSSPKRTVSGPASFLSSYQNQSPLKVSKNESNFNMMQQQYQNQQQFPNQQFQNDQGIQNEQQFPNQQYFQNQQQLQNDQGIQNEQQIPNQQHFQNQYQPQSQQLEQQQVPQTYSSPIKYSSPRRPLPPTPLRSVSYHGSQSPAMMNNNSFRALHQTPAQITPMGLSQSLHEVPFNGDNNSSFQDSLSPSMNGDSSMRGQRINQQMNVNLTSPPPFHNFCNVSIATQIQSPKSNIQSFNQSPMGCQQDQSSASLNNAMEKLCESMKRSAMTRSIVKQISGRNLVKQTSARGLLTRQNSGLQRSTRSLMDENSGRSVSIRRVPNAKHHLQHHGRGLFSNDSQHSLNSYSNHGGSVNLQIDGRNIGAF